MYVRAALPNVCPLISMTAHGRSLVSNPYCGSFRTLSFRFIVHVCFVTTSWLFCIIMDALCVTQSQLLTHLFTVTYNCHSVYRNPPNQSAVSTLSARCLQRHCFALGLYIYLFSEVGPCWNALRKHMSHILIY